MAAPQYRVNQDVTPILRLADALIKDNETFAQDAGRGADLAKYTVVARDPAANKLVVLAPAATDGTEIPCGLMAIDVAQADIVAGDVTGLQLYIKTGRINEADIILETGTLDTEITNQNMTIRDMLYIRGIYPESGYDVDRPENT